MQRKFHYINNYMKNLYLKNSTSQASLNKPLLEIFSTLEDSDNPKSFQ